MESLRIDPLEQTYSSHFEGEGMPVAKKEDGRARQCEYNARSSIYGLVV